MRRGWQNFGEVDSGQLQGQGSLGQEIPRVRKGKVPSSPSTKNYEILARVEWGQRLDVPESPEVEGGGS